ncbi:MAG: response regulator [Chloroflexi bacterium]|nr:response regulator [Chloroflexota bacterium]
MTVLDSLPQVEEQVVVCLEDDRDLARLIQITLRPWTESFHVAYDGIHGLDLIQQQRPSLILLDLNLPGMNGLEVYDALQADPDLSSIPVVMLSANQRDMAAQRSRRTLDGVVAYIVKPFTLIELRDTLRPYLDLNP